MIGPRPGLIVQAENHVAGCRAVRAVHDRAEPIAGFDAVGRIDAQDVSVVGVLREGQERLASVHNAVFELWAGELQDEASPIAIRARARQLARIGGPDCLAGIRREVIGGAGDRRS